MAGHYWGGGATKWGNPVGVPRQSRAFLHLCQSAFFRFDAIFPFPFSLFPFRVAGGHELRDLQT